MRTLDINASTPYKMTIGTDILTDIPKYVSMLGNVNKVALISDSKVAGLYANAVLGALSDAGYETVLIEFPEGEENKNLESYGMLVESLARSGLTRSDVIIALGGGVTGDMAGFAAATYLRGIKYVQMPTTYLAAVDSSVGGKTAVDLDSGKNLLGAFWQPSSVLLSYDVFRTLTPSEFLDGSAEAFKTAMIADRSLAEHVIRCMSSIDPDLDVQSELTDEFEEVIAGSVAIKAKIVEEDERDTGSRQLLNFGHTIGHAIEKLSGFAMPHGHAVARGMAAEARAAKRLGLTECDAAPYIEESLEKMGFDLSITGDAADILKFAESDKKVRGNEITVVAPEDIGKCVLKKIPVERLGEYIDAGISE